MNGGLQRRCPCALAGIDFMVQKPPIRRPLPVLLRCAALWKMHLFAYYSDSPPSEPSRDRWSLPISPSAFIPFHPTALAPPRL